MNYYDAECPYCNNGIEINHDDGYGYEEGVIYQQRCSNCDKRFVYSTNIRYTHETEIAPCLNGEPHKYELTDTYPKRFSKMRCTCCDDERQPTPDERVKYELDQD